MFDHEGTVVVSAMCKLTAVVFEHLDIIPPMDVDQRVSYTQCILRGSVLKNYKLVLVECKKSAEELTGDKWDLGVLKGLSTEDFWDWAKKDGIE